MTTISLQYSISNGVLARHEGNEIVFKGMSPWASTTWQTIWKGIYYCPAASNAISHKWSWFGCRGEEVGRLMECPMSTLDTNQLLPFVCISAKYPKFITYTVECLCKPQQGPCLTIVCTIRADIQYLAPYQPASIGIGLGPVTQVHHIGAIWKCIRLWSVVLTGICVFLIFRCHG